MFQDNNINTYRDEAIGYFSKCIDVPRITVRTLLNKKPWVNLEDRAKLKAQTDAYTSDDLEGYLKSRYVLRRAISSAKKLYRDKVESNYQGSNTRNMWAELRTITDYKTKTSSAIMYASLPDELNTFYACFENNFVVEEVQKTQDPSPLVISREDVCKFFKRINKHNAPGPDGIPGQALKVCADQLADFHHVSAPVCSPHIVPIPKTSKTLCLNNYCPVAITIIKCFKRLVKIFNISSLSDSLDPLQFAYRPNSSTDNVIAQALSHLDRRNTYVRMLFNTIVPGDLGLNTALCDWILNFLMDRP